MTPDEVVERLNKLCKRSCGGSVKLCISENEAEALSSAITLLQDYQKLRGITKDLVRKVRDYADIGGKEFNQDEKEFWTMCEKTDEVETYLQQPTEHREM